MMKEYLPYLASILSGLLVFLLGRIVDRLERKKSSSDIVEIKEIDDRARLTKDLWEEYRTGKTERIRLNNEILEERGKNLKLEIDKERLAARIEDLEKEIGEWNSCITDRYKKP